jgi:hypothetical protein
MSETTHLICAHCGHDNPLSNAAPLQVVDGRLPVIYYIGMPEGPSVFFHCQICDADYKLPIYCRALLST